MNLSNSWQNKDVTRLLLLPFLSPCQTSQVRFFAPVAPALPQCIALTWEFIPYVRSLLAIHSQAGSCFTAHPCIDFARNLCRTLPLHKHRRMFREPSFGNDLKKALSSSTQSNFLLTKLSSILVVLVWRGKRELDLTCCTTEWNFGDRWWDGIVSSHTNIRWIHFADAVGRE